MKVVRIKVTNSFLIFRADTTVVFGYSVSFYIRGITNNLASTLQEKFIILELVYESVVGTDDGALALDKLMSVFESHVLCCHQIGNYH